jgi:mRNA interferase MazF
MSQKSAPWQVWLVDLSPVIGAEQAGPRPAVVVSSPFFCLLPDRDGDRRPGSTRHRGLPHHVAVSAGQSGVRQPSWARTDDVRSVSEQRLIGAALGTVTDDEAAEIRTWLRLMVDI